MLLWMRPAAVSGLLMEQAIIGFDQDELGDWRGRGIETGGRRTITHRPVPVAGGAVGNE